jgi:D-glycero-D-manno-heptose 1,7-bisphosphate phosphatase
MRPLVLLDRDGTVIVEKHHLTDPAGVELIPGAARAIRELRAAGFPVALITNQSAIGRGLCDRARVDEVHARLAALLEAEGAALDGIWICPHAPNDGCTCRKPSPELLYEAAKLLDGDLARSWVVGDKRSDIEAGRRAGARTILVRTGHAEQADADHVADDLPAAVAIILG